MVLINKKTGKSYSNVSVASAARRLGAIRSTIYRWGNVEFYNNWIIGKIEEKEKQKKGFACK